jgi:diguanylate cyclase (GGDEF)-like protein
MGEIQDQTIRVLLIEDVEPDAERVVHQFRRAGLKCEFRRVETGPALLARLVDFSPAVILSDFTLPQFDGMSALRICREQAPDVPFLFVSGTLGEERAVAALQAGASDYVLKENLARLVPAVRRAIEDAHVRAERARQEAQILRLNRVLRMLDGVNDLVFRLRDRTELLAETCRLAVQVGGYAVAVAATAARGGASVKAVASGGLDEEMTSRLMTYVEESAASESSVVGNVFRTGKEFVCNDTVDVNASVRFDSLMIHTGLRSVIVLPLLVDEATSAVLLLTARDASKFSAEELEMLRKLARSLSFGLQYVNRDTRMRFLSHFDPQTGLARRALFCERVRDEIVAVKDGRLVVAIMDVRSLSAINDSFGRNSGDLLLRQIAERLKQHYPRQGQLAHFGGGTFALVRKLGALSADELHVYGQAQGRELFGEPILVEGRSMPVAVRMAYALYPDDGVEATVLVQNAEAALHSARAGGRFYVRFDSSARVYDVGQLALEHRLRFAIERNEFELHYQPKVNIVTRRLQGAEALLRWRSPEDGLVSPGAFLPALESSGLILEVGDWVVRQAARDCRAWRDARLPPLRVAVNIAPEQLRQHEFETRFLHEVRPWADRYCGLDVEITEGVLQEDCSSEIKKLERLRAAGVRIAVDDFGTGYSSLSRLSEMPVDTLKIDRRFITQIVDNPKGSSVVKTVVALAHAFNMTCVAEGVEKQAQLDVLWQMGCDQSQGYLHSAALAASDFMSVLRNGRGALLQPPETP